MSTILSFIIQYKIAFIILAVCGLLWLWHVSIVTSAERARDAYWTELIKNSPTKIDTVAVHHYTIRKDTSGVTAGIAAKIDSAYRIKMQALLQSTEDKDSILAALSIPYEGTIKDTSFGKLAIIYYPLYLPSNKFAWELTERPPIDSSFYIITKEKMVSIPFRTWAISGGINPIGQVHAGIKNRVSDFWVVGLSYQVLGDAVGTKWTDKLRLEVDWYVY